MGMKYLYQKWCGDSMFNKNPLPDQQLKLIRKEIYKIINPDSYRDSCNSENLLYRK